MTIEFVDNIPAPRQNRWNRSSIIAQLKANPGQWALIETGSTWNAVGPHATALRKDGCEAATRRINAEQPTVALYARWNNESA
jgi:hypothetical protein